MEDRTLLSNTYVVDQLGDSGLGIKGLTGGTGDIRFCVNQANLNPGSTISFDTTALFGAGGSGTIALNHGELPIKVNMTIEGAGSGPSVVTISGTGTNGSSRIFDITSHSAIVSISDLTITGGNAQVANTPITGNQGGDLFNGGTLTLTNDIVTNGMSTGVVGGPDGRGGAIYDAGGSTGTAATLTLDSTIVEKSTAQGIFIQSTGQSGDGQGGGVYNDSFATLIVQNGSQIVNNKALGVNGPNAVTSGFAGYNGGQGTGGGIYNNKGSLQLNGSSATAIVVGDNLAQGGTGGNGVAAALPGNDGGDGGAGGASSGGGVFNTGALTLQYVNFLGNQAIGGAGGIAATGAPGTASFPPGGTGGNGGNGGNSQGGAIYSGAGALTVANAVFGVDGKGQGNQVLGGAAGAAGTGGAGAKAKAGGHGGDGGSSGAGGFAKGGAVANFGGAVSFTNTTLTSSEALGGVGGHGGNAGNGGVSSTNGATGGRGGAGADGGPGGDAVGGAVFNSGGNLSIAGGTLAGNQAFSGTGGIGGNGGVGATAGAGSSKITGGVGGAGGAGGAGGTGGNAQGGGFYNVVGTVTINGTTFLATNAGVGNEAISSNGGAGGVGGNGGQGGDNTATKGIKNAGDGGAGGVGGAAGNAGLAEGGAGGSQGGGTTVTSAAFTSSLVQTGTGGTGGNGGTGGAGGNGSKVNFNGYGGAGGNGGAGGTGAGYGGALAVTASNLTVTNSSFGLNSEGNQVVGGAGGAGGIGGTIGTFGHSSAIYELKHPTGNGGQGGAGASVYGGAISASGNTQTIQITGSTFTSNGLTSGDGGGGGAGGVFSADGASGGLNGQGGAGGLAQGGAILLAAKTSQNATLSNDTLIANSASGGTGGAGTINDGEGGQEKEVIGGVPITVGVLGIPPGSAAGLNGFGSNGGNGGSVQGVGLADVNYNLTLNSSSFNSSTALGGKGGAGGGASDAEPWTFRGGNGGAGGNVQGGGVFVSNNGSGTLSLSANGSSALTNNLTGGNGGRGGDAGQSGQSNIQGGPGGGGGYVQGGGLYILAGATGINTSNVSNLALAGNVLGGGTGGAGGAGFNAVGGNGGNAQGGAVFSSSLNSTSGKNSSLNLTDSTLSDNRANGGIGGDAGEATTPNGGAGGSGGSGGNADGAGLFNGNNTTLMVVNTTFGGSSDSNVLAGGRGGSGGDAGTPEGVLKNNGGPGGAGGSISGANVYNASNAAFINDTIVYGQAVATGVGGPGGSGAGNGGQKGPAGSAGTALAGGYFAAAGTNSVGNSIIDLNTAAGASTDVNGAFTSLGNNILGSTTGATGFSAANKDQLGITAAQLNLGPLQNNGGPTSTDALLNNSNGKSAAIDAGGNTLVTTASNPWYTLFNNDTTGQASDQRGAGYLRIYNGMVDVGAFEVQTKHPIPVITGLNPPSASEGSTSITLTITGNTFAAGATVDFGGTILTPTSVTSTQIMVTIPGPLPVDLDGPISLTVDNPDGSGVAGETVNSAPAPFAITEAAFSLVNPGTQSNNEGDSPTLTIAPASPDTLPDVGNFSAAGLPTGLSINSSTGVISGTIDSRAAGSYTVTVTAYDGPVSSDVVATTTFTWNVADTTPPTLTAPPNQTNNESDTITPLTITAVDADPNTFSATGLPTGLSISSSGVISGTIGSRAAGPYTVTVSATDDGFVGSTTFTWTVNDTTPPAFTIGNQTSNEGATISLSANPVDADASSITDVVKGQHTLPPGLSIDPTTGLITGTIGLYSAGSYTVTLSATDGTGNVGSITFTWTVSDTTPPSFTVSNQTNNESDDVNVATNPADADAGSITATGLPTGLSIDSTTGQIAGTLGAYSAGTYNVTLSATDGAGNVGTTKFTWTVNDTTPPSFTVSNQTSNEGDTIKALATSPVDADAGSITDVVNGQHTLPTGLSIDPTTGIISGTIGSRAAGTYKVTLTATDGTLVGTATFTWTVNDTTPPAFTNPGSQNSNEGDTVSVATSPVDGDATSVTDVVNGQHTLPPGLTINATTGVISGTINKYGAGTYDVTISATDGTGNTGSITFTWIVADTTAPTLNNPGTLNNNEGDTVNLQLTGQDAESFSATGLPTGLSIDPTTGLIAGNIGAYAAGTYTVVVTANDGTVSTTAKFTWNVADTTATSFTNPGTQNNNEGDVVSLATNPVDADPGSITATGLPPGLSIDSTSGVISGTIDPHGTGAYTVTISGNDGSGNTGSIKFTWNVANSTPPALTNPGAQNSNEYTGINLAIQATDADSFSATGLPPGLRINPNTGAISGTVLGPGGTYQVTVTASDGSVASSVTFPWTVNQLPVSVAITNVQYAYVGLYQVETVTAQVSDPEGILINQGSITFQVNDETITAPVHNGVATVTFATPMISLDLTILLDDFFSHMLSVAFNDSAEVFDSGSAFLSDPAMLLAFVLSFQADQFASLGQQLSQSQS